MRSPIYGDGGSAINTQQQFLTLFESSVIENDLANSVQRYQLAVQNAKVRLDMAIAPGVWLMPSNMIINTESVVGYNNKLMKATEDMKFGSNNSLNTESKSVGISHSLGSTKVKLPHNLKPQPEMKTDATQTYTVKQHETNPQSEHEVSKLAIIVVVGGLALYLFR